MNGTIYMPVGEVCSSISDTYREKKNMVTLINTSDVLEGRVLNHERVPNSNLKGQFKKTFQRDDILYSEIRPQNRRFAYVDFSPIDYIASTKLMVIRAKKDVVSPKYLYYFLKNSSTVAELQLLAETRSGTFPQITFSEVANLTIPVPSLAVQEVIVQTMQCLEDKITCNEQINDNLLAQAQTLYKQFFPYGVQDDLPDGWRIGTVGEIIEIHDSKRIPLSGADRSKMEKKIYPYYGAASLMDLVDNYIFDGKYLLLGEDGTVVDDAGYPILQYVWGQFWVNNHAHILTGRLGYDVESLYMLFKQTPVKSIVTGAVQPKISQANLRSVQVVIPPEHNLREYNDLVEPLFSLFRANEEECKTFTALRDTLLPKLMSGEIDVSAVQL